MALIKSNVLFHVKGAKTVSKQRVSLRPVEHHYETEGEEEYIKYSCQLCESIAKGYPNKVMNEYEKFIQFSFPKGTKQCPCCGAYIDWNYKEIRQNEQCECKNKI